MNKKIYLAFFVFIVSINLVNALEKGGLGIGPYQEADQERRSWFIYKNQKAGDIVKDRVLVNNTSGEPMTVLLYAVDAQTTEDGGYAPKADDAPKEDVGAWVTLEETGFDLKPGENKIVGFSIKVPEKVTIGDHFGTILVRRKEAVPVNLIDDTEKKVETGYNVILRVGARIYLTVAGKLVEKLLFENFVFGKNENGEPSFLFSLANDGNVRLTPQGRVEIFDEKGVSIDSFNVNLREIFPYTKTTVPMKWANPRFGKFKAKTNIDDPASEKDLVREIDFEWQAPIPEIGLTVFDLESKLTWGLLGGIFALLLIVFFLLFKRK